MIFCTTMAPEKYTKEIGAGLYGTYCSDMHLFNLASRVSTAFFMYEPGVGEVAQQQLADVIFNEGCYMETLAQEIDGVTVRTLMETTTPEEFFLLLKNKNPDYLAIKEAYRVSTQISDEQAWLTTLVAVRARALQYKRHYKGPLSQTKNVVYAAFGGRLSAEETGYLQLQLDHIRMVIEKTKESR